jgi:hypothetical protein
MKDKLLQCLDELNLPKGQYCIFGGASLAIRELRPTDDIDFYVTKELYQKLKAAGWEEVKPVVSMAYLVTICKGVVCEAFTTYNKGDKWIPKIDHYIAHPEIIDGFPFMPLAELYEWKANTARDKDLKDLKIIEAYWAKVKA